MIAQVLIFEDDVCTGCDSPKVSGSQGGQDKGLRVAVACDCDLELAGWIKSISNLEVCDVVICLNQNAMQTVEMLCDAIGVEPDVRIRRRLD